MSASSGGEPSRCGETHPVFSPTSQAAVTEVLLLASSGGGRLTVLQVVAVGQPAEEILRPARDPLLVIGARHRSCIGGRLFGTTGTLSRDATFPVLAVRLGVTGQGLEGQEARPRNPAMPLGQRFLSEAGRILAESLDYQSTLKTVARLAVPDIADWCAVDLLEDDGTIAGVAIAHRDPARLVIAQALQQHFPPRPAYVATMRRGLEAWLESHQASSLDEMKGTVSPETQRDPGAFERAHYIRTLHSWTR